MALHFALHLAVSLGSTVVVGLAVLSFSPLGWCLALYVVSGSLTFDPSPCQLALCLVVWFHTPLLYPLSSSLGPNPRRWVPLLVVGSQSLSLGSDPCRWVSILVVMGLSSLRLVWPVDHH